MAITVSVSTFKAKALGLIDRVATTGDSVVVTKHGRPVARLVPYEQPPPLIGSVEVLVDDDELLAPVGGKWAAETDTAETKP